MRITQILTLALLATTACARQQVSYYTADPATHQAVPVVQRAAPNAPPQYAQASAQTTAANGRGLLNTPQPAAQSYAQASYGQATYQAPPQQQTSGRGLSNTYTEARAVPAYGTACLPATGLCAACGSTAALCAADLYATQLCATAQLRSGLRCTDAIPAATIRKRRAFCRRAGQQPVRAGAVVLAAVKAFPGTAFKLC
jgi:hypothetical protein